MILDNNSINRKLNRIQQESNHTLAHTAFTVLAVSAAVLGMKAGFQAVHANDDTANKVDNMLVSDTDLHVGNGYICLDANGELGGQKAIYVSCKPVEAERVIDELRDLGYSSVEKAFITDVDTAEAFLGHISMQTLYLPDKDAFGASEVIIDYRKASVQVCFDSDLSIGNIDLSYKNGSLLMQSGDRGFVVSYDGEKSLETFGNDVDFVITDDVDFYESKGISAYSTGVDLRVDQSGIAIDGQDLEL
ncbi:MAG: hypothetical protein IKM88_10495 [Lachnospiraceae bacterium]|nr:hypothetical protein [Lachnospiraceae bacterium]MBR6850653.1 hypothetical protein [Lachnospiraceae bacterium]